MKRLNVRLLAIVGGALLVMGVCVYFVHGWQVSRHAEGLLRRAELAESGGDLPLAVSTLGQYLRYRPEDHAAHSRQVLLMEELTQDQAISRGAFLNVQSAMERAIRGQPENTELRQRAADFYLRFGRPRDAIDHVRFMLAQPEGAGDADLQLLHARCLHGGGE